MIGRKTIGALVLVLVMGTSARAATIMAHYDMEDQNGGRLTDVSGNGRHATFGSSGHSYVTDSAAGTYAYNRAGGWQVIPNTTPSSGVLSLSLWYKDTDAAAGTEIIWGATSTRAPWTYVSNSTNVQKLVYDWGTTSSPQYQTSPNNVIVRNSWQHIVFVMDSVNDNVKAYVDTVLKIDRTDGTNIAAVMRGHLGITPGGASANAARFDDVQFYDGALTADQVSYLYNNPGLTIPEPATFALAAVGLLRWRRGRRR